LRKKLGVRKVPIIEVDMLIAFVNASDNLHNVADRLFLKIKEKNITNTAVATSAYLEYELIHKSKGYLESDIRTEITAFQGYPNLDERTLTSEIILKASELRGEIVGLTYFDSLHASTALLADRKIISTDPIYDKVKEIERLSPQKL
jgi:predicted nucleic acid-binding protein